MSYNTRKLKEGEEVHLSIPFLYTIGEVGFYSGKLLETIEDCEQEIIAEIDFGNLNGGNVRIESGDCD